MIEHLELPLVLINSLPLPPLSPLRYISLIDPAEKRHYPPLIIVLLTDSCLL
jgi:hypothetical protein